MFLFLENTGVQHHRLKLPNDLDHAIYPWVFARTNGSTVNILWKLPDIEEIQVCSNHDPQGCDGAPIGDQSFACRYIEKFFKNLFH